MISGSSTAQRAGPVVGILAATGADGSRAAGMPTSFSAGATFAAVRGRAPPGWARPSSSCGRGGMAAAVTPVVWTAAVCSNVPSADHTSGFVQGATLEIDGCHATSFTSCSSEANVALTTAITRGVLSPAEGTLRPSAVRTLYSWLISSHSSVSHSVFMRWAARFDVIPFGNVILNSPTSTPVSSLIVAVL